MSIDRMMARLKSGSVLASCRPAPRHQRNCCMVKAGGVSTSPSACNSISKAPTMLTTTRDMILPTAITGSYPRPLWFDANLGGRSFKTMMGDSLFREQYLVCRLLLEKKKNEY